MELLNEQDQVIQSNATGTFINLPAGKYRTRLKIDYCGFYYIDDEHWVTLTDASTGPKILNSTGLICEAPDGTPQNTGNAYLNLSGVPPLVLTYKEQGSSTIYDVPINPSLSSLSLTVEGLTANITYQFVLRDGCGGSTPINVTVQTLSKTLTVANTVQPCYNQPYTLSMPYYPQASYVWKNPSNAVVSTHRDFQIANYTEAYDGVYTCDISWGNCLSRFVQVRLDGKACGTPLNNYWIGTTDNVWNKDENWTGNKIPPTEADVEFATVDNNNGNPAVRDLHVPVNDPKVIGNLINNSEKDLVVVAGSRLTVNGKVIDDNAAAGTIVVKSKNDEPTGTLLFKKPEQNQNVAATVEFYNKGYDCSDCGMYRRSWQYFALPLKNLDQFPAGDVDGEETINQWTEPFNGDKWRPATFPMTAFKGYEITNGSNTQPSDVYKMRGELVVGDATVPLTRTDGVNYAGVNLVGNSYTAAIDIKNGLTFPAEVQQTVYLFNTGTRDQWRKLDGSTVSGYQAGRYLAVPKNTAGTGNLPDRIPSMHAFMVRLESGTAANLGIIYNRLIENSTVNDGNGTQIAWRSAKNEKEKDVTNSIPTLIMDVLGGQSADRLWIFAKEGSTFGFDNGWDGYKMAEAEITQLYALSNTPGEHFAVATVPALDNLKVGFEAPVEGNYTFEFALSGISSQSEIYLHDLAENRSVRVTDGASYSFDAKRGAYPQRFYLACSGNPLFQTDESSLIVLKAAESGTMAIANNNSRDCTLFISGLDGKLLQQVEVAAGEKRVVENLPGDLCIVRLQNAVVNEVRRVMVRE